MADECQEPQQIINFFDLLTLMIVLDGELTLKQQRNQKDVKKTLEQNRFIQKIQKYQNPHNKEVSEEAEAYRVWKYASFNKISSYTSEKIYCDVWRENQVEQIDAEKVVVGDIVELGAGSVIPADGWVIEGELKVEEKYSYGTIQASKTTIKGCINHLDKNSKNRRKYTVTSKIKPEHATVQYSPVVLGGSTVIEGEGRMLVLCVGKFSRKGEFELLLKNFNPNRNFSQLENKMEEYTSQLLRSPNKLNYVE